MHLAMKLSQIAAVIIPFFIQPKNYTRIVGVILFTLGLVGFAFRSDSSLPDGYLSAAIVLGFWGIVSGLWDGGGKYGRRRATDKAGKKTVIPKPPFS